LVEGYGGAVAACGLGGAVSNQRAPHMAHSAHAIGCICLGCHPDQLSQTSPYPLAMRAGASVAARSMAAATAVRATLHVGRSALFHKRNIFSLSSRQSHLPDAALSSMWAPGRTFITRPSPTSACVFTSCAPPPPPPPSPPVLSLSHPFCLAYARTSGPSTRS